MRHHPLPIAALASGLAIAVVMALGIVAAPRADAAGLTASASTRAAIGRTTAVEKAQCWRKRAWRSSSSSRHR